MPGPPRPTDVDIMKTNETERVKKRIHELLTTQKLGALATTGPNGPNASLVAFAADRESRFLLFATARTTRKYGALSGEKRAAMLTDNGQNLEEDFHRAMAVTVTGRVEELAGAPREAAVELYLAKHPYLEAFVLSDTCAMMRITAEICRLVENFQKVSELHLLP